MIFSRFLFLPVFLIFSSLGFTEKARFSEDKSVITEITLGDNDSQDITEIYISPSCLHCGKFLNDDLEEFLKTNEKARITIKLLPISAKDIFIMKIIQNKSKNKDQYLAIFKNYMLRISATINYITPTKFQINKFRGSKTNFEMIKFQVIASEFGFSDEKIIKAFPEMNQNFEKTLMKRYVKYAKDISKLLKSKELSLPLIVKNGEIFKNLNFD